MVSCCRIALSDNHLESSVSITMNDQPRRRRSGSRSAKKAARQRPQIQESAFIERRIPYYELLDEAGLALIETNADLVLEEIGIDFRDDPEALRLLRDVGADVQGERVRFPKGMCRAIIQASAPAEFTQYARNPQRNVVIGGRRTVLAPAYGSPFIHNFDEGRRYATIEDFRNFVKLTYMSPGLHHSGGTVCEPVDLPVNKRHFDMIYSHIKYSDKPFMGSVTHPERAQDTVDMAKIVFGEEFVEQNTVITSLINANSPLTYDATMLGAAKIYARHNQATVISPFILAGAMSPVTVTGTVTQILAEALAGMAFIQIVRPGAPVVFGTFSSSMSMQSERRPSVHLNPAWCSTSPQRWRAGWVSRSAAAGACVRQKFPTRRLHTSQPTPCRQPRLPESISCCIRPAGWKADWQSDMKNSSSTWTRPT